MNGKNEERLGCTSRKEVDARGVIHRNKKIIEHSLEAHNILLKCIPWSMLSDHEEYVLRTYLDGTYCQQPRQ